VRARVRPPGAVIGSTAIQPDRPVSSRLRIIGASAIDEEGALLDFDYREVQAAQAIIANARSVMLSPIAQKTPRSAPVRIAHISQIQTLSPTPHLPQALPNICHSRGIEGDQAMPKSSATSTSPADRLRPSRAEIETNRIMLEG